MPVKVETRPSGAHRWANCSAAPLFASRAGPQPPGDPAREGTAAAWVAEQVLNGNALLAADLIGAIEPRDGWEVDAEMAGHAQSYVDMIRAEGGFVSAERFVRLSEHVAGTLDNSASFLDGVVRVRDLKYGFKLVEADAEQLVIYAAALCAELMETGQPIREVWTEIYQPRGFHPDGIHRRKCWTVDELFDRARWLAHRAELCHQPDPVATPGTWCTNCDGANGCAALKATTASLMATIESDRFREASPQELARWLLFLRDAYKIVGAAKDAAESEALARYQGGEYFPGLQSKDRQGKKKFKAARETIRAITGIDPVKETLMSPAELKAAGATDRQLKLLTHTPIIGRKLVPADQKELASQFKKG